MCKEKFSKKKVNKEFLNVSYGFDSYDSFTKRPMFKGLLVFIFKRSKKFEKKLIDYCYDYLNSDKFKKDLNSRSIFFEDVYFDLDFIYDFGSDIYKVEVTLEFIDLFLGEIKLD